MGNDEDDRLWKHITQGLKAFENNLFHPKAVKNDKSKQIAAVPENKTLAKPTRSVTLKPKEKKPYRHNLHDSSDIDRRLYQKLTRGQLKADGVLDLHGKGHDAAFDSFERFIKSHASRQSRMVIVITGKGERLQGLLRQSLPSWCEAPHLRQYILKLSQAQPKDGGAGAYYVLLRRV